MLLRNLDCFRDLLDVDVVRDTRDRRESNGNEDVTGGFFFEHENSLFALGVESSDIYVILNGTLLKVDSTLQTHLTESLDGNTFMATHRFGTLCCVYYKPVKASGLIPNEDDECLDGFLWMHKVLRSPERLSQLLSIASPKGQLPE